MNIVKLEPKLSMVSAEVELLDKLHQAISEYAGVITVAQAIGILEVCKREVIEGQ